MCQSLRFDQVMSDENAAEVPPTQTRRTMGGPHPTRSASSSQGSFLNRILPRKLIFASDLFFPNTLVLWASSSLRHVESPAAAFTCPTAFHTDSWPRLASFVPEIAVRTSQMRLRFSVNCSILPLRILVRKLSAAAEKRRRSS